MPIAIHCDHCHSAFHVQDEMSGKRIRCPRCQTATLQVPELRRLNPSRGADVGLDALGAPAAADQWQVKSTTGQVFGPVAKIELDQWMAEGRISPQSQILAPQSKQWQWATDYYPQLVAATAIPPAASPAHPPAAAPVYTRAHNVPTGRLISTGKSKTVAGILGIVLGGLGVHRFYLGFIGIGITQIIVTFVTCGFGGVWGLVEGILILTDQIDRDAQGNQLVD